MGGRLPYPTDGSGYSTLSSDMAKYHGNTHAQGGIKLDTNQDAQPDIEIENKEVIKDNMVLSDRLYPSKEIKDYLSNFKVKLSDKDTYAGVAEKLGKAKGKFEKNLTSTRLGEANTAKITVDRLDNAVNMLFEDQQMQNGNVGGNQPMGYGALGMKFGPDPDPEDPNYQYNADSPDFNKFQEYNPELYRTTSRFSTQDTLSPEQRVTTGAGIPAQVGAAPSVNYGTGKTVGFMQPGYLDQITGGIGKVQQQTPLMRGRQIGDYRGDIAALAGTAFNQAMIGRLETNFKPKLVEQPNYNFTSRLPYLTSTLGAQFSTASQGIQGSSAQDNNALKANLYAKNIGAINSAMDSEIQRKDAFDARYNDSVNRTNMINTQLINQGRMTSMDNRNQKRALTQKNVDNLVRSYMGNEAIRNFRDTEDTKMVFDYLKGVPTGVSERFGKSLDAETLRKLRFNPAYFGK